MNFWNWPSLLGFHCVQSVAQIAIQFWEQVVWVELEFINFWTWWIALIQDFIFAFVIHLCGVVKDLKQSILRVQKKDADKCAFCNWLLCKVSHMVDPFRHCIFQAFLVLRFWKMPGLVNAISKIFNQWFLNECDFVLLLTGKWKDVRESSIAKMRCGCGIANQWLGSDAKLWSCCLCVCPFKSWSLWKMHLICGHSNKNNDGTVNNVDCWPHWHGSVCVSLTSLALVKFLLGEIAKENVRNTPKFQVMWKICCWNQQKRSNTFHWHSRFCMNCHGIWTDWIKASVKESHHLSSLQKILTNDFSHSPGLVLLDTTPLPHSQILAHPKSLVTGTALFHIRAFGMLPRWWKTVVAILGPKYYELKVQPGKVKRRRG